MEPWRRQMIGIDFSKPVLYMDLEANQVEVEENDAE